MLKALKNKKDFRKKLLITLGILALIQIASGIPTPGVNTAYFRLLLKSRACPLQCFLSHHTLPVQSFYS